MHVASNSWYVVLESSELTAGRAHGARRFDRDLVFWRGAGGQVYAALDRCPHRGAKLSPGLVIDGCVECPFHGFRFDGAGACTAVPAHPERPIPSAMSLVQLEVREAHGFIWLWTGPEAAPEAPLPFFDFEGWRWEGSGYTTVAQTHYTRAIENQLDWAHLAFVHRKTIGRFVGGTSMEVDMEVDGARIEAWSRAQGREGGVVEFWGPNIWRLNTGGSFGMIAFVPEDEGSVRYYMRSYQRFVAVPGLSHLYGKLNRAMNKVVIREDLAVVEGQGGGETRLRMGEVLVPSDAPIIAYRRWREARRAPFDPAARVKERRLAGEVAAG